MPMNHQDILCFYFVVFVWVCLYILLGNGFFFVVARNNEQKDDKN